jgi:hypothetical protein
MKFVPAVKGRPESGKMIWYVPGAGSEKNGSAPVGAEPCFIRRRTVVPLTVIRIRAFTAPLAIDHVWTFVVVAARGSATTPRPALRPAASRASNARPVVRLSVS